MHFDGATYVHDRDGNRLGAQYIRVFDVMKDGQFRSLKDIAAITGDPESSVSARLRDMRKERFGSHKVERRHVADGLFEYKLVLPEVLTNEKLPTQEDIDNGPHAGLGNIPSDYTPGKVTMTVDGWTVHDGGDMPFPGDTIVKVKFRDGFEDCEPLHADFWIWRHWSGESHSEIVAYKVVTPN